ncbi:sulfate ABC transporter permease [Loigolactobacillus binensis]|uniref:Sulfate ABC transporter permease n=1 Tax=Loigolactobacillus binensis TaxID=2559922 RepID=A0ABW3EDQ5_9LACO|nr:sulfate ABC transporter permease subunit [Loigolactobacillus binensis]
MQLLQAKKVKWLLLAIAWLFIFGILILPLALVVMQALALGWRTYLTTISSLVTLQAVNLTVAATVISLLFNLVFGISAAWLLTFYDFPGKHLLNALIDLPFSVSPVIVGLIFVLTFGQTGWLAPLFTTIKVQIIFAPPAIFLTTIFVTFPFVARELIPVLAAKGREEEQTAALLGASAWQILRQITFPALKAPLATGLVLATARALGEFGAVAVVSGSIRGKTLTLSLLVQTLYNNFKFKQAFVVATILLGSTLAVVILKRRLLRE